MESKYINFLLNENEINKIAKETGLCTRIRKFTPMELLKMAGLKIHFIKDLKNSSPVDIAISEGTKNDFKFLPRFKKILRKNDLVLNDLGYYSLEFSTLY